MRGGRLRSDKASGAGFPPESDAFLRPAPHDLLLRLGWLITFGIRPSLAELIPAGLELAAFGAIDPHGGRPAYSDPGPLSAARARR
jgi:hypothetical protein